MLSCECQLWEEGICVFVYCFRASFSGYLVDGGRGIHFFIIIRNTWGISISLAARNMMFVGGVNCERG